ncbi:hypothetical protein [Halosimplex sp. J119]
MGERGQRFRSAASSAVRWLLRRVLFLAVVAVILSALVGGFVVVLFAIDWFAVNALAERGGRDYWVADLLTVVTLPVYLFVAFRLFSGGYPSPGVRADKYVDFGDDGLL